MKEHILCNQMELCSKDNTSPRFRRVDLRKTFAACEYCGMVLCIKHLVLVEESYFCKEHADLISGDSVKEKLDNDSVKHITSKLYSFPKTLRTVKRHVISNTTKQESQNQAISIEDGYKHQYNNNFRSPIFASNKPDTNPTFAEKHEDASDFISKSAFTPRIKKYTSEGKVVQG